MACFCKVHALETALFSIQDCVIGGAGAGVFADRSWIQNRGCTCVGSCRSHLCPCDSVLFRCARDCKCTDCRNAQLPLAYPQVSLCQPLTPEAISEPICRFIPFSPSARDWPRRGSRLAYSHERRREFGEQHEKCLLVLFLHQARLYGRFGNNDCLGGFGMFGTDQEINGPPLSSLVDAGLLAPMQKS